MTERLTTHELAEFLGRLLEALKEGPDLPLGDLLKQLGVRPVGRLSRRTRREGVPAEPLPPVDPKTLSREELAACLRDKRRFRTKKDLVAFARLHAVAVSEKDRIADIIGQILRTLYDIPQQRMDLLHLDLG